MWREETPSVKWFPDDKLPPEKERALRARRQEAPQKEGWPGGDHFRDEPARGAPIGLEVGPVRGPRASFLRFFVLKSALDSSFGKQAPFLWVRSPRDWRQLTPRAKGAETTRSGPY